MIQMAFCLYLYLYQLDLLKVVCPCQYQILYRPGYLANSEQKVTRKKEVQVLSAQRGVLMVLFAPYLYLLGVNQPPLLALLLVVEEEQVMYLSHRLEHPPQMAVEIEFLAAATMIPPPF